MVSDEAWLGGELLVKAIAEHEGNNALWQFEAKGFPKRVLGKKKTLKLIALRRPIAKMKMKRNGDLGTDPRENFEALADCPDSLCQQLLWDATGITYLRLVDNDHLVLVNSQDGAQLMREENLFHKQLIGQLSFSNGLLRSKKAIVLPSNNWKISAVTTSNHRSLTLKTLSKNPANRKSSPYCAWPTKMF